MGRGLYLLGGGVDFEGVAVGWRRFGVRGAVVAVSVVVNVVTVVVAREVVFTGERFSGGGFFEDDGLPFWRGLSVWF